MSILTTRRSLVAGSVGFLGLAAVPAPAQESVLPAEFPRQDDASVKAIVGAAHTDYDAVKKMVSARPALAKASWDWGFRDWESPIGSAGHMGRPDIALLLMEHGARPNLFTHAMLGHLAVVQATVEASPGVQKIRGPHGITLLQHALMTTRREANDAGTKKRAQEVADYLTELGGAGEGEPSNEISEAAKETYLGEYRFGPGEDQLLEVKLNRAAAVTLSRGSGDFRILRYVEEYGFAPGRRARREDSLHRRRRQGRQAHRARPATDRQGGTEGGLLRRLRLKPIQDAERRHRRRKLQRENS